MDLRTLGVRGSGFRGFQVVEMSDSYVYFSSLKVEGLIHSTIDPF